SVSRSNHSCKRHSSSRAASSYKKSSIFSRVTSCTRGPMAQPSLRTIPLVSHSLVHWHGGGLCALHQRVPLTPESAHLQLVVHQWLGALHATRDVRPLYLAISKTLLARLQRFNIVWRRKPTWAQEGEKIVQAQGTVLGAFVLWRQSPGVDLDVIRCDGEKG